MLEEKEKEVYNNFKYTSKPQLKNLLILFVNNIVYCNNSVDDKDEGKNELTH
jgi:hypothetical protein